MTQLTIKLTVFFGAIFLGIVGWLLFNYQLRSSEHADKPLATGFEDAVAGNSPTLNIEVENNVEEEVFSDETRAGRPGKNKVVIRCYEEGEKAFAQINFYFLSNTHEWKTRISNYRIQKDSMAVCDPQIKDFNNDGLGDVTFASNVAARGANEVRTLLVYNKEDDSLDLITNSAEYPNLEYNKELDCITAWAFHGATTTIFLSIEGDRLREFAAVGTGAERVVTLTRRNGKSVVVRREEMNEEDIYTRYSTFDPPTP